MTTTLKPETEAQLRDAIAWAAAEETPLELVGRGSKRGFGRPVQAAHTLDLSAVSGIVAYEPEELVLTVRAATPMAEIDAALRERGQMLAFEPPDLAPLYGGAAGEGTLGGVLACNLAGPRRIKAGAARDHFLGFAGVSGRGEIFKAGGKVVKNVTGYDLPKLVAGSHGTLVAMSEVTVKVLPAPAKARTVLLFGCDAVAGVAALADALNSPNEVSAAAWLPAVVAALAPVDYVRRPGTAVAAVRIEGTDISVAARTLSLQTLWQGRGPVEELHSMNSARLWRAVRDVAPLLPDPGAALWRLSVPPAAAPAILAALAPTARGHYLDWAGGLIWLAVPAGTDAGAATIRATLAPSGGHATLMRAPETVRVAIPVFEPLAAALAAVSQRVKESFDPHRVLNPGRMVAGV